jgi:4-aminobutyrate aminotransferase/(S)-3-amino-2-methylpropionate transaminase
MKGNECLLAGRNKHIPQGPFNVQPIFAEKAKGAIIIDVERKEYIDFAGGIGVANIGHCDEEVIQVIQDQIQKYIHTCFHVVMYEPYVEFAKRLNQITPGDFSKKNNVRQQRCGGCGECYHMSQGELPPSLLRTPSMVEPSWP